MVQWPKTKKVYSHNNGIEPNNYILSTIHRPQNTDDIDVLMGILNALNNISIQNSLQIVLPLHPRTANMIQQVDGKQIEHINSNPLFKIIEPVGFLEMILLEKHASMIMTDSGGVQKEAFFMQKPCVILRPETEWTEIVELGCAQLAGSDPEKILARFDHFNKAGNLVYPEIFGQGQAAEFICQTLVDHLN